MFRHLVFVIVGVAFPTTFTQRYQCWPAPEHDCCRLADVDENTFEITFETESIDDANWRLDMHTSWEEPGGDAVTGYGTCLKPLPYNALPYPGLMCKATDASTLECDYLYTSRSEYIFVDVMYGHELAFIVRSHGPDNLLSPAEVHRLIETPDCFEETGDRDYCKIQPIPIASKPTDVTMKFHYVNDTHANVAFSWREPVQLNGVLSGYQMFILDSSRYPIVRTVIPPAQNLDDTHTRVEGLLQNSGYTVQIEAGVQGITGAGSQIVIPFYVPVLAPTTTTQPPVPPPSSSAPPTESALALAEIIAIGVCGVVAIIIIIVIIVIVVIRTKKKGDKNPLVFVRDHDNTMIRKPSAGTVFLETEEQKKEVEPIFADLEMERSKLKIEDELGSGQFGVVYKAFAFGIGTGSNKEEYQTVAVKGIKKNANRSMKEDFLDEIKLIIEIGSHRNILAILGCITVDEPYYLVTEFMEYGDLQKFLWKCREEKYSKEDPIYNITDVTRLQIGHQIARGMDYLSKTRYYHGDLAARNILVGKDMIVKISDFGMAEDVYMRDYKRLAPERRRPVKWVSLETNITGECSIQSDVWSFGIVLYEIYTLGGVPYPTMDAKTVLDQLQAGYRMEKPTNCPNDVYDVMLKCWSEKPGERPPFHDLYLTFDKMLASQSDYLGDFDLMDGGYDEKNTGNESPNVVITSPAYADQITNAEDKPGPPSYVDMKAKTQDYVPPMENGSGIDQKDKPSNQGLNPTDTYFKMKLRKEVSNEYVAQKNKEKPAKFASSMKPKGSDVDQKDKTSQQLLRPTDTYHKMKLRREVSNEYVAQKNKDQLAKKGHCALEADNKAFDKSEEPTIDTFM